MACYYNINGTLRKGSPYIGFVNIGGVLKQITKVFINIGGVLKLVITAHLWSSGGNLGTARYYLAGCGTQAAGLSFGGYTTGYTGATEEYDGAAWSIGGNLLTVRNELAGAGIQSAGLSFGGQADGGPLPATEKYS